jgi:hypothetical protein
MGGTFRLCSQGGTLRDGTLRDGTLRDGTLGCSPLDGTLRDGTLRMSLRGRCVEIKGRFQTPWTCRSKGY